MYTDVEEDMDQRVGHGDVADSSTDGAHAEVLCETAAPGARDAQWRSSRDWVHGEMCIHVYSTPRDMDAYLYILANAYV